MGVGRGLEVGGGGDRAIARIRSSCTYVTMEQSKINSLAISISSILFVKSLCQSMQLAIEPFLCHC